MRWALTLWIPVGLMAAFFILFAGVFTDGPGGLFHPERLVSYALAFAVYGLAAAGGARLGGVWWHGWITLGAPGLLLLVWYGIRESGTWGLVFVYLTITAIAIYGGLELGALWLRRTARAGT